MAFDVASAPAGTQFLTFGAVHLDVVDRDRSVAWWRDVVGLPVLAEHGAVVELGVDGEALIVLHAGAVARATRDHSGLYHLAINLPSEPALAQVLSRLLTLGARFGATDHIVAKSLYLQDPNGVGLELTFETPERVATVRWPESSPHPDIVDSEGRLRHGLEDLDLDALLAAAPGGDPRQPVPAGTKVGHLHLQVGDLETSYGFYRDRLGLEPWNYVPAIGYGDLGAGAPFTHRIAVNTWQGAGLPPAPAGTAGMRHATIRFDTSERLRHALARVDAVQSADGAAVVRDPDGNAIHLTA